MNLFDTRIPYTVISTRLFRLTSLPAILAAITFYQGGWIRHELRHELTQYELRKTKDTLRELNYQGIISIDLSDRDNLPRVNVPEPNDPARIVIPTHVDYAALSLVELKTYIACHYRVRYGRKPYFQFTATHEDIAKDAKLSRERVQRALKTLEVRRLIETKKIYKIGTQVKLLDPESSTSLYEIGLLYAYRLDRLPVLERYKYALEGCDPRNQLHKLVGHVQGFKVNCPFCHNPNRTFRFTATDTDDFWKCHNCNRGGDSARLLAKYQYKIGRNETFGRTIASIKTNTGYVETQYTELQERLCINR